MVFKRWYRELGGLAVFLLIFYATVVWTNGLTDDEESSDVNAAQMSKSRLYSEAALRRGDFSDASVHLKDLLESDPHNSHARYQLAECYHQQFVRIYLRLHDRGGNRITIDDPSQLESLELELKELADQATELYRRCTRSHRYRGDALLHMSVLSGLRKDREEALAPLERFLSLNYSTSRGIAQFPELAFLLDDPEFQKLIVVEQKIKREKKSR